MLTIKINMDAKCKRCHKGGATQNGYCMKCIDKMLTEGKFNHILKRHKAKLRNLST